MKQKGVVINKTHHPEIHKWLDNNVNNYYHGNNKYYVYNGEISVDGDVQIVTPITHLECIFSEINGDFVCNSKKLCSFKNFPKKINGDLCFYNNSQFSNDPKDKEKYKLYIAMWLELFESVSNAERKEYVINYKSGEDWGLIPIEILKEYGF